MLTSGGGLWRTNNWMSPNTEWTPLTDDLPTTGGGGLAFGRNPNTLYLGLGDFFDQILVGGSMTRSKNGPLRWKPPMTVWIRSSPVSRRTCRRMFTTPECPQPVSTTRPWPRTIATRAWSSRIRGSGRQELRRSEQ